MHSIDRGGGKTIDRGLLLVVTIGFLLRLAACWQTQSIGQDGPLYIFQAQSIHALRFNEALGCLAYLSSYPFLIALVYPITGDWIQAGQLVSAVCGTATVIPVFFLVRRTVDHRAALVTAALFAALPVMVGISAEVLRDASFWLLIASGLHFFLQGLEGGENRRSPVLSSLMFLLATWTRIEGIVFLVVSTGFLLLGGSATDRMKKTMLFLSPLVAVGMICTVVLAGYGISPGSLLRIKELLPRILLGPATFSNLRAELATLISRHPASPLGFFLKEARNLQWLVALGVLLNRFLETMNYLYAPLFLAGIAPALREGRKNRGILYLLLCCTVLLVTYFYQIISNWILFYRMMATILLPASVVIGLGAARLLSWVDRWGETDHGARPLRNSPVLRFACGHRGTQIREGGLAAVPPVSKQADDKAGVPADRIRLEKPRPAAAPALLIGAIVLFSLPKNLAERNLVEASFRKMGEVIAAANPTGEPARIWTSPAAHRIASCYANRQMKSPPCPEMFFDEAAKQLAHNPRQLLQHLTDAGFRYFVWEESFWGETGRFDPEAAATSEGFHLLDQWQDVRLGKVAVYDLR